MKKINFIVLFLAALVMLSSCKRALDAPLKSSIEDKELYSTVRLAEGVITGILQTFAETNSYRGRYIALYGSNTDTEILSGITSFTTEKSRMGNYNTNVNNTQMNASTNVYAMLYSGVERANLAIRGFKAYGDIDNNAQLAQLYGEVLTLRAFMYMDLIKGWGNVPARFEPVTNATLNLPRSDMDVIYKQILADLFEAEKYLAWPNATARTSTVENINKAFAKGLRARIALMAGGYNMHLDGTTRLSNDPELTKSKMYQIVKDECLALINENRGVLLPSFQTVFQNLCKEITTAGQESMWELPFAEGRGRVIFDLGVNHASVDKYTAQARGGSVLANPAVWYEYDKEDTRRNVSVTPYGWGAATVTTAVQKVSTLSTMYLGKYRYEWMTRRVTSTNDDGINWMVMRFSDVILMAAEAINEIDGPAAALPQVKKIVDRAYGNNTAKAAAYMTYAASFSDKQQFLENVIMKQRALEFVGEMIRKQDLIRWNILDAALATNRANLQDLHNKVNNYAQWPTKVYWKLNADNETIDIYGLDKGDTDAIGAAKTGYTAVDWKLSSTTSGTSVETWNALYVKQPSKQPHWPIWQVFLEASDGKLNNSYLGL
ncbi:RagB/SusD family nutrient uptake outer membrane protein [Pedobacter chitinilyticus]|uniref:RagB/SusD family nutrient uptake outer membrane protein n=1 Tax=Pedobacter chitinilyticus TaxID=2233776 RepID=A0A3S3PIQ9_9SPHI|nr:RagB/SusD family nutrient uptake outer membrane protein [Pedobacter chitinilyticus]RWU10535.1 RagB/SusD family nutrient uptake outer membrane protein [Pedobacter chitinilyticus]